MSPKKITISGKKHPLLQRIFQLYQIKSSLSICYAAIWKNQINDNQFRIILKNSTVATDISYVKYCAEFLSRLLEKDVNLFK
mgnify:CR=1 FL=1